MKFKAVINNRFKYYSIQKYRGKEEMPKKNLTLTNKSQLTTIKLKPRIIHFTPTRKSSFLGYSDVATKAHKSIKPGMSSSFQPDFNFHCRF